MEKLQPERQLLSSLKKKKCIRQLLKLHMLRRLFLLSYVGGTIAVILSYKDLESMFNSISLSLFGVAFTSFVAGFGQFYLYAFKQKKRLLKGLGKFD